jgi:hypothetical protein
MNHFAPGWPLLCARVGFIVSPLAKVWHAPFGTQSAGLCPGVARSLLLSAVVLYINALTMAGMRWLFFLTCFSCRFRGN